MLTYFELLICVLGTPIIIVFLLWLLLQAIIMVKESLIYLKKISKGKINL